MKKIILYMFFIFIIFCFAIYFYNSNYDTSVLYYEPKLYPILNEYYRPSYAGTVAEPQVRQLSKNDKGIVFELVDSTGRTEPYKDTFYAMLTEDKVLKYYNGYIWPSINGIGEEGGALDILGLSHLIMQDKDGSYNINRGLFEFQVLYREYTVKLTKEQYKKMVSILNKIDEIDKGKLYSSGVYDESEFRLIADFYAYNGLCIKSGYYDSREAIDFENLEEESYFKLYNELYSYVQELIPDFEPYEFGKS